MSRTKKHILTGAKARFHSCRNHGECPWCIRNRTYRSLRELMRTKEQIKDLEYNITRL